jgi:hypothetical protein
MVLALLSCDILRAEKPAATNSAGSKQPTISKPVVCKSTTIKTTAMRMTKKQDTQQPLSPAPQPVQPQPSAPAASAELSANIFGTGRVPTSQLAQERRSRASAVSSDVVSGGESRVRATTDAGSLLAKSSRARGVSTQHRTPIVSDTRIRGAGVGRMVASGG